MARNGVCLSPTSHPLEFWLCCLQGFFDDEDEDEGMGGENAGCAEAAFVPVTPSSAPL